MRAGMRWLLLSIALLAACRDGADKPLEPVWGKQPCDHCAMLLDEPRFAGQLVTADGTRLYFDDVGCLAAWLREHETAASAAVWVHRGDQWTPARDARFVAGPHTPMGYGFVAADAGLDWPEVQRRLAARAATGEVAHAQ
jgi:hypothetical protein